LLFAQLNRARLACLIAAAAISSTSAQAVETPTISGEGTKASTTAPEVEQEKKNVEKLLLSIETDWNAHNLDAVMGYYADDYLNNDGLDRKAVSALTSDFWKTYPDAKSTSQTKEIRIEGPFATVISRDTAVGTTAKEMPVVGTKGELESVSEGQMYIKKLGGVWRIVGDRVDYEKVRVAFGLAQQLSATFAAPEQVKAGKQYTARLELKLPAGVTAVASISSTPLEFPQTQPDESWRPMTEPSGDRPLLERVMSANAKNRNELLMAAIGITNSARNSLMGIAFLTRRLNVVPNMEDDSLKTGDATGSEPKRDSAAH
jgi:hypothetical protein